MALNLGAVGQTVGPLDHAYGWKDVALYALALGAGPSELPFVLEPSPRVLPTFPVIPAFEPVFAALRLTGGDLLKLLHTAQRVEQLKPFPAEGVVRTTAEIQGIWDMRIGAVINVETRSSLGGELYARTLWSLLIQGETGFPSERPPTGLRTKPPKDASPAFTQVWATQPAQALLYRLTGDLNPIHARPEVAASAGLPSPILHGLCSYGFAARVALAQLAGGDPARFRSFEARFSKPVLPGQTLIVEGYTLAPGSAAIT
ncbi:MAG TPA: MaoC/PaaZ C-terminal domain-containing protein, partial [Polyangiales bacterium]